MNQKKNGNSARNSASYPREYYLPAAHAQNITQYRQSAPPDDDLLGVESFDYGVITVLHLTGLTCPALDIQSVFTAEGTPLEWTVQNEKAFFSRTNYPVRLAYGAWFCLLLRAPLTLGGADCVSSTCIPSKISIETNLGKLVFEVEDFKNGAEPDRPPCSPLSGQAPHP